MIMFFDGSEEEAKEAFKDIFAIGPIVNQTGEVPFEKINSLLVRILILSCSTF